MTGGEIPQALQKAAVTLLGTVTEQQWEYVARKGRYFRPGIEISPHHLIIVLNDEQIAFLKRALSAPEHRRDKATRNKPLADQQDAVSTRVASAIGIALNNRPGFIHRTSGRQSGKQWGDESMLEARRLAACRFNPVRASALCVYNTLALVCVDTTPHCWCRAPSA
jgi:hypothetical protein